MRQDLKQMTQNKSSAPEDSPLFAEFSDWKVEYERLYQMRLEHVTPIHQPLILISQIPRSGGSLLSQLFDGHPQCHTHPFELFIGFPNKWNWPDLDLSLSAERWFEQLFESPTLRHYREGYRKYSKRLYNRGDNYSFLLLPNLQREIFLDQVAQTEIKTQRDVLNCYMTSYFNAWLDYQELYRPHKKYLVGFVPHSEADPNKLLSAYEESTVSFFNDYPEGKLLSLIRDPKTWYASARRHNNRRYPTLQRSIALWKASAKGMLTNKRRFGDRVCLLRFETLLQETEKTMRTLAAYLGLDFDQLLLKPTFQGMDIRANSVDAVQQYGVLRVPLSRAQTLSQDEVDYIHAETQELYEAVLGLLNLNPIE